MTICSGDTFLSHSLLDIQARCLLSNVPGFANVRVGDKPNKVDLAIVRRADQRRTLVTAKSDIRPFDFVLLPSEFDPARLARVCEFSAGNTAMFSHVVHISPQALAAVYGPAPEPTMQRVLGYIHSGRILALDHWLAQLLT